MLILLLFTCFGLGSCQEANDDKTLLSIKRDGAVISIRDLPRLLERETGLSTTPSIVDFLQRATVENLSFIQIEIVHTTSTSVSSSKLCTYAKFTSIVLSGLQVECHNDFLAEASHAGGSGRRMTGLDQELNVNDPDAKHQSHLKRMRMGEVWNFLKKYYVRRIRVVVIDSGIDFSDKDLAPVKGIYHELSGEQRNGAWNFHDDSEKLMLRNGHGTRVARVLAATANNSYGMKAIDVGADIVLMPMRIRTGGEPIPVLNEALEAVKSKGIFIISAAGNDNVDARDTMPCAHGGDYGICVGALNNDDDYTLADWSNFGDSVDIAAFGEDVYVGHNDRRAGTSYSAPLVTAAVGILVGMGVDSHMIKPLLMRYARPLSKKGKHIRQDSGALDVLGTIKGYLREIGQL